MRMRKKWTIKGKKKRKKKRKRGKGKGRKTILKEEETIILL